MVENEKKLNVQDFIEKNIMLVMLLIIVVVMFFVNKNFLTVSNLINILRNMAVTGVMGCGMTMLMVSGDFDLSFGSTLGLTTCMVPLMCEWFQGMGMGVTQGAIVGMLAALIISIFVGFVNGYFSVVWRLPAMLVTIAMQYAVYGLAGVLTKGFPRYTLPGWYGFFGKGMIGGVFPISVIILLVMLVLFYIILAHTKFGRTMYTIGGNRDAARLSGINVTKYKIIAFIVMQITAWVAGIIFGSQLAGGTPTYGKGMEFNVIAAVIIGGISLYGGAGSMKDTFIGLLFLNLIMNAMTIANLGEYAQYVVRGLIMLGAIVMSEAQRKMSNKRKILKVQLLIEQSEAANQSR